MKEQESTVRARELGEALRQAMQRAELNGRTLARRLGWSEPKVSSLLNGRHLVSEVDLSSFLALCGVIGAERAELLRLNREQKHSGEYLTTKLRTLASCEEAALAISNYEAQMIPGLLQTPDYMWGLMRRSKFVREENIAPRVDLRIDRQTIFDRTNPPRCTYFIEEAALRSSVGAPDVMSDQLHHLLRMSVRPYINIQVVPSSAGVHAGLCGAFALMRFDHVNPVVYLETSTSNVFIERPESIAIYEAILSDLSRLALSPGESAHRVATIAAEFAGGETDDHD
ncbi:helix-turn-helix domain-containing protein [Solihabitans fulvus]|nr:helix-turn-helix transcriptional regulator [Solihabitans fulvus]